MVALSQVDLHATKVPVTHYFELVDDQSIYSRVLRLPPKENMVVREERDNTLDGGIVTPKFSVWYFPVGITPRKDREPAVRRPL